jgi:hypothetical protein
VVVVVDDVDVDVVGKSGRIVEIVGSVLVVVVIVVGNIVSSI